jgi:putative transposase
VLCEKPVRLALRAAIVRARAARPFDIVAWVLLPDHLHCIWRLPEGDAAYPARWNAIKGETTRQLRLLEPASISGRRRREGGLWQRRFWEHTIRDEPDLVRHIDYVHWNPIRHGLVRALGDWPYSSFHRYLRAGFYPRSWCGGAAEAVEQAGEQRIGWCAKRTLRRRRGAGGRGGGALRPAPVRWWVSGRDMVRPTGLPSGRATGAAVGTGTARVAAGVAAARRCALRTIRSSPYTARTFSRLPTKSISARSPS